jgi:hypothetical protein
MAVCSISYGSVEHFGLALRFLRGFGVCGRGFRRDGGLHWRIYLDANLIVFVGLRFLDVRLLK